MVRESRSYGFSSREELRRMACRLGHVLRHEHTGALRRASRGEGCGEAGWRRDHASHALGGWRRPVGSLAAGSADGVGGAAPMAPHRRSVVAPQAPGVHRTSGRTLAAAALRCGSRHDRREQQREHHGQRARAARRGADHRTCHSVAADRPQGALMDSAAGLRGASRASGAPGARAGRRHHRLPSRSPGRRSRREASGA